MCYHELTGPLDCSKVRLARNTKKAHETNINCERSKILEQISKFRPLCNQFIAGDTAVLVGVHGPAPPKLSRLDDPLRMSVDVLVRPATGRPSVDDKTLEAYLIDIIRSVVLLEEHPRT